MKVLWTSIAVLFLSTSCTGDESSGTSGASMNKSTASAKSKGVGNPGVADAASIKQSFEPIGDAILKEDGTIILNLRAEGKNGEIGHTVFEYPPTHPRYKALMEHIGKISVGESVLVYPWPKATP